MDCQFPNILAFGKRRASLLLRELVRACQHICCETAPKTLGVESELSFVGTYESAQYTFCETFPLEREGTRDVRRGLTGACRTGEGRHDAGRVKILQYGACPEIVYSRMWS